MRLRAPGRDPAHDATMRRPSTLPAHRPRLRSARRQVAREREERPDVGWRIPAGAVGRHPPRRRRNRRGRVLRRAGVCCSGAATCPPARSRAGLVVCPPILADFGANYQREVRLGRQLAAAGVVVQRFHPRGAGQSDGDGVDLTLDSMIEDAMAAVTQLRERSPVETVAVAGHPLRRPGRERRRAPSSTSAPVVLWEPTTDPRRYFREGLRARSVHQFKAGTARRRGPRGRARPLRLHRSARRPRRPVRCSRRPATATWRR